MKAQANGRLRSRPTGHRQLGSDITGLRETGLETERDGFLYVPTSFNPRIASPFLLMLHGVGNSAQQSIDLVRALADRTGTIVLAPSSQGRTWDALDKGFGADVELIDEAMSDAFSLYRIDPTKLAIGGFADGASYALSLGLTNGDLFSHVVAFSPSVSKVMEMFGTPKIFVSHGVEDATFPIEAGSRQIVPKLKSAGFDVNFQEFAGGHAVPSEISQGAFNWFVGSRAKLETRGARVLSKESGAELT